MIFIIVTALLKPDEAAAAPWVSVRSEHFFLVGHVGERELRSLAVNLERFRAVFSQLLPESYFAMHQPAVIVVFADDEDYSPFKPLHEGHPDHYVAGYFRAGGDLNYLTLAAQSTEEQTTSVLFHEYVHSLVKNNYERPPLWFNEGLAEYYSAYDLAGVKRRQVRVGKTLSRHAQHLRTHALLPLSSLLRADWSSPLYTGQDKRKIFYAQSWALVHYLLSDQTGARQQQLAKFLSLTAEGGVSVDDCVRRAFQIEPAILERRLAAYVRAGRFAEQVQYLPEAPRPTLVPEASLLGEAEVQARLGDLLLRTDRFDEAHTYLQAALADDPNLAAARISLALLYLRLGRQVDAKEQMKQATAAAPMNYLAHYYYADLLRRDNSDAENTPAGFVARTALIKAEISRAIELAPDFLDAQGLLVLTEIERSPQLGEATDLLSRLMKRAPGRRDFKLLQAQLNLRQEKFDAARAQLLELINDSQTDEFLRLASRDVLDGLPAKEKLVAARRAENEEEELSPRPEGEWQPCDMPEPGPQLKARRFAGVQSCGRLEKVECQDAGVVLFVRAGERTLRLHSAALDRVKFVTYTSDVKGKIECGERASPEPVLVTYRPGRADSGTFDGELKAVEFVPQDWLSSK